MVDEGPLAMSLDGTLGDEFVFGDNLMEFDLIYLDGFVVFVFGALGATAEDVAFVGEHGELRLGSFASILGVNVAVRLAA
jgi:hypothetical protein